MKIKVKALNAIVLSNFVILKLYQGASSSEQMHCSDTLCIFQVGEKMMLELACKEFETNKKS